MTAAEHLRRTVESPRAGLPTWLRLVVSGAVVIVILFALTAANAFGQAALWENAHWTVAAAVSVGLSVEGISRWTGHRSIALWLAAGPVLTLAGQLLFDIVVALGAFSVPAIYDPLFLVSYPMMVVGLFLGARLVLSRAEGAAFLIDASIALLTVTIVTLAVFDTTVAAVGGAAGLLITAYPVVFLGTALATLLAQLVLRRHSVGPGLLLIAIGSILIGANWMTWLAAALEGPPAPGSLLNYAWSVGVVLTGLGIARWRFDPSRVAASDELRLLRGILPIVALLISLGVLVGTESMRFHGLIEAFVAAAVLLAMVRQTLLLFEREHLARRDVLTANEAERLRLIAEDALTSQRASEERYRGTVEVFNRLGDQVSFASSEVDLLRSAVAAMARLAPSDRGALLTVSPSADRLVVSTSWGDEALPVGAELDEPPVRCLGIRRGSAYLVEDASDELTLACPAHPAQQGTVMCIPLMALGETIGVAHLERREPHSFDADAPRAVSRVAEQVALAVANTRMLKTMESLALTDQLTRLHNARFFEPYLDRELATAERDQQPLAVIMIDLDHFKQFNDTYGHGAGDDALKAFSRSVLSVVRESDTVARYGGEEFVVAARHADLQAGVVLAERMRMAVERSPVELGPGRFARFTASFGVASTERHGNDRRALMKAADEALYEAKRLGRNRVEAARVTNGLRKAPPNPSRQEEEAG